VENFTRLFERWMLGAISHEWVWRLLVGIGIAVAGYYLAKGLARLLDKLMLRFHVDAIMRNFLRNLAYAIALVVVFIAALDFVGVPTTSLLAVLGAAGLAIGLALKDSLSNIASGVMLIALRPFRAGDSVQIAGLEGVVESVRIFQTRMHTGDNREIILPNSQITTAPIINFTGRGERRVDINVPMGFDQDFRGFREALLALARAEPRVHAEPAPDAVITSLGEGTVTVQLRAWTLASDFGGVQAALNEAVLADYARRGFKAPLPQREVHVFHHDRPAGASDETAGDGLDEALKPRV
jgi:small conductance mechanosensitive channel